jgi:hypothetical protein
MSHDTDKEALIVKYYPDPEHRVVLDYVAKRAAQSVVDEYGKRMVYTVAGKAALGMMVLLIAIGGVLWGVLQKAATR